MNYALSIVRACQGDKYSPSLLKFLKKHHRDNLRVYTCTHNTALYVGYIFDGDLIAALLRSVMCEGARACMLSYNATRFEEVPGAWDRYAKIGRCILDPNHSERFTLDAERFVQEGETRTCQWCGAVQVLHRWEETVVRTAWKPCDIHTQSDAIFTAK